MFKLNTRLSNNQRGLSLVEIMIGVAMLGGLSVAVINMTKQQAKLSTKTSIDGDISEISARILNALNSPRDCQMNFQGKPVTAGTLTDLKVIGGTITPQTAGTAWVHGSAGNISDRVRMNSATWTATNSSPPTGNPRSLAALSLVVQFETTALENSRKTITKTFSATVVVNGTANIVGCPKTWNSTAIYGE